jgi:hypothetical protein
MAFGQVTTSQDVWFVVDMLHWTMEESVDKWIPSENIMVV